MKKKNKSAVGPSQSYTPKGPITLEIQKKGSGIQTITVKIAPHHVFTFTGGAKPKVSLACTHHGFVAEACELNGQLEQVINHVRKHFPKLRVD